MVRVRIFSHRFHRIHRNSCWGDSPTDFTDQHRWLGCVDSPTDFTEFTEVRVHPLKLAASEFRGGLFSFVLFVLFVFVSSQASGSVNSVKSVGEPTHPTNLCQSVQSVGGYPQQKVLWILCNLWEDLSHLNHLCRSVQSVGGYPQQKVLWILFNLWEDLSHSNHLCRSVKSVGGHPKQAEAIRGSLFAATVSRPVTNIACYSVLRTSCW